jgi:hypothetical protein
MRQSGHMESVGEPIFYGSHSLKESKTVVLDDGEDLLGCFFNTLCYGNDEISGLAVQLITFPIKLLQPVGRLVQQRASFLVHGSGNRIQAAIQKENRAPFLQEGYIFRPLDDTAATGNDDAIPLREQPDGLGFCIPEAFFTFPEQFLDVPANHFPQLIIRVNHGTLQLLGNPAANGGFARTGHTDEYNIVQDGISLR